MNSHSDRIAFKEALQALREGNPFPLSSGRTDFPSEENKESWQRKAESVQSCVQNIESGNVNDRGVDRIKHLFVDDPDIRNLTTARHLLKKLIDNSNNLSFDSFRILSCGSHHRTMEDVRESFEMTKRFYASVRQRAQQCLNEIEQFS